jgi:hypothetical protein
MPDLQYKSRVIPSKKLGSQHFYFTAFDHTYGPTYHEDIPKTEIVGRSGTQDTGSAGHPWRSRSKISGGTLTDIGGDFITSKFYQDVPATQSLTYSWREYGSDPKDYIDMTLEAPIYAIDPSRPDIPFPSVSSNSFAALDKKGAVAVALCKPTNSVAQLSVALGELYREHLPNVPGMRSWQTKLKALSSVGDEFLNAAFGWMPLVNDVRSTANAVQHGQTVLTQFERDAGRVVRRGYSFPVEHSEETSLFATRVRPYYGPIQGTIPSTFVGNVDVYRTREITRTAWFSGAFSYHLPSGIGGSFDRHALEAKKVFGVDLTPSTLWALTPWSWAIDWVSNTSDVISNLTDWVQYGLIMRYGYLMEHTVARDTYHAVQAVPGRTNPGKVIEPLDVCFVYESKVRRRANPYGFGMTWDGLNPFQLSILAALGISKG